MNRIDKKFSDLRKAGGKALIAFFTAGDYGLPATKKFVLEFEENGVDIIELGVPFSDPIADGPTIQASSERSLKRGTKLRDIISVVGQLRKKTQIPIVLMGYYNPILKYGPSKFVSDCVKNGVDGAIIPDLPPEEAGELTEAAKGRDFDIIFLLSPTSTLKRIKMVSRMTRGFIYYVSLTGITGARSSLPAGFAERVKLIKKISDKPVCVGFGVSMPKQVERISAVADGVIVGSAIVKQMQKNSTNKKFIKNVGDYVRKLAEASHQ
jgi:tryptophan synthase alpha chain